MSAGAASIPSRLSLRANFSWAFVGNIVYAACQWGMLIVLAKLGSPGQVGQFALGLAVTAPVMMFASLDLRLLQATDALEQYRFGHYLALRIATTALATLVIGGITALAHYPREASWSSWCWVSPRASSRSATVTMGCGRGTSAWTWSPGP